MCCGGGAIIQCVLELINLLNAAHRREEQEWEKGREGEVGEVGEGVAHRSQGTLRGRLSSPLVGGGRQGSRGGGGGGGSSVILCANIVMKSDGTGALQVTGGVVSRGSSSRENSVCSRTAMDGGSNSVGAVGAGGTVTLTAGSGRGVTDPMLTSPSPTGSSAHVQSAQRRLSKTCCFCWCCCCSCSCITVQKEQEGTKFTKLRKEPITEEPVDDLISDEEIRCWGESFDKLIQSEKGRELFREFLRSEYSEENILFWIACEELKRETNPEQVEEKARSIYEDFISILSPKEVSLDSKSREIVNRNMFHLSGPSPNTFDDAQLQIYTLMRRDSYPRFLNSNIYKKLLYR